MTPAISQGARRFAAAVLIIEPLLFFAAFGLLASAINWPASLGLPYDEILPLILAKSGEVRLGYSLYLASSLLTIPMGIALLVVLKRERESVSLKLAAALMFAAAVFKALGITRWLIAMPALANLLAGANGDPAMVAAIKTSFMTLNEYAGGGLGEWMGVGLMSGLWMLALATHLRNKNTISAGLLVVGGVAGLLLCWNAFHPIAETSILQAVSRSASMLAQFWLAFIILRSK
jgi:hypothetical protein